MDRNLSLITPTGRLTLGNHLGALRRFVDAQEGATPDDCFFGLSDLHALTTPQDPVELRATIAETAALFLAAGLDPTRATLFRQSQVPAHRELAYLLESTAYTGELSRMIQFKEKGGRPKTRASLFTYPCLMAADILLYDTDRVPVGDDQRQHLELTRDLAVRFNSRYGDTFVVPEAAIPHVGARVMDLQHPTRKMSKSDESPQGTVLVLEDLKAVARKIKRAVTDTETEVRFDPVNKPGVSNLLSILAAATGKTPEDCAAGYTQYGPLKTDTAEAVVELLRPIQARYRELVDDPAGVATVLAAGAGKARAMASVRLAAARERLGLLPA
jgi:tryptophanyl-tRNA synthetase